MHRAYVYIYIYVYIYLYLYVLAKKLPHLRVLLRTILRGDGGENAGHNDGFSIYPLSPSKLQAGKC